MSRDSLDRRPLLVFDKEGSWHIDGVEVLHENIYLMLSGSLRKSASTGTYEVRIGQQTALVCVEAAPFVVKMVERIETANGDASFVVTLNDGSKEKLNLNSLFIGMDNSLYCEARGHLARFKRPAFFELAKYVEEEKVAKTESRYYIKSSNTRHYIKNRPPE